ncbi:hypothetical protein SFOMI_4171 [Sphingobium fuliginis]|uniref:Uncharacterized protein n=1 Tax=Sphingobium fuliginis (strain ATCC 27551) TaxID=336203 RepID=A0A292ZL47_SPHSA|nr:hypothetical protein SFOMI_4171 [Sphingobium fuliginis]
MGRQYVRQRRKNIPCHPTLSPLILGALPHIPGGRKGLRA